MDFLLCYYSGASLFGNLLVGKRGLRTDEETIRAAQIERYQNESKFNCFYLKNNLPKIKNGT